MHSQKISYSSGTGTTPLCGVTIGQRFDEVCQQFAQQEALVSIHQDKRFTYAELHQVVENVAANLLAMGLKPGDRLAIWSPNCWEWSVIQFATAKAGIILVNLNPAYRAFELEYVLNKVSCVGIIIAPTFKSTNYEQILRSLAPELATLSSSTSTPSLAKLPSLKYVIKLCKSDEGGIRDFADLLQPASDEHLYKLHQIENTLDCDDTINIQFTSGTTGQPKGTMLTHHGMLNNAIFVGQRLALTSQDRLCLPVPLFHCIGMVLGTLTACCYGAASIYTDYSFNVSTTLQGIESEKCTSINAVPAMLIAMLDHPDFKKYNYQSLRTGIAAGSPCPREIMVRVVNLMHLKDITIAYGMTETSPVSIQSYVNDSIEKRVSTVGRVQDHIEIKIINDQNKIVPLGERGELCVRGYSVMAGYWDDEAKTREVIDEHGWMHTGDIAQMDEEGYVQITGRIKDMVIRGGENLFPKEIEEFLYKHPDIVDIQVVGVPDPKYGEELCACIILKSEVEPNEEGIREFCKSQLSFHKIPRYFRFYKEFPMTASGKIQKYRLREALIEELQITATVFDNQS
ncbi:AMP-binding protein [Brackiella oedipodis]|uniref:AMP-binding protein n=1 Tax=Brackiella oedipodis TaxID=124225 RepID=UPI00048BD3DC|nr:AMP-binding protein [Brackiella oedipodis]